MDDQRLGRAQIDVAWLDGVISTIASVIPGQSAADDPGGIGVRIISDGKVHRYE